jgi:SAM-dependent methyltransferase
MGLSRFMKDLVPFRWKVRFHSKETLTQDIAARVANRLRGGCPLPSRNFIYLVSGHRSAERFLRRGLVAQQTIRHVLASNGIELKPGAAILDFGCGVGRIMRHWKPVPHLALYGTDYNPRLVEWCRRNLSFAEFGVNALAGKLPYAAERFDFIYAFSVFTHLSEPLQCFWMQELSRVLRPGGQLYFTTHGEYFLPQLSLAEQAQFLQGQLVVRAPTDSGSNLCASYHPASYVRNNLARQLSLVDFIPGSAEGDLLQDIYLLEERGRRD